MIACVYFMRGHVHVVLFNCGHVSVFVCVYVFEFERVFA